MRLVHRNRLSELARLSHRNMNEAQPNDIRARFRQTVFSEALIILVITAGTYLCVYVYEAGYCSYFDIPAILIRTDIATVLAVAFSICGVGLFLFNSTYMYFGFRRFFERRRNPIVRREVARVAPFLATGVVLWVLTGRWFVLATVSAATLFHITLIAIGRGSAEEKLRRWDEEVERTPVWTFAFGRHLQAKGLAWIVDVAIWAVIVVAGFYFYGEAAARRQSAFLVTDSSGPVVVLRSYGDLLICAEFDAAQKLCSRRFAFIKTADGDRRFELQLVGPLKQAPPLTRR